MRLCGESWHVKYLHNEWKEILLVFDENGDLRALVRDYS
jgi:hypothetical protein